MIKRQGNKFEYTATKEGPVLGEISFLPREERLIEADHTFVDASLRGQGVAGQLLEALVVYARHHQLKILPTCSYIASAFDRSPELYQDVDARQPS